MIEIKALSLFKGNIQRSDKKADFWNSFREQTHQFLYPSFICSKDHRQIKQNGNKETVITTVMHQSKKEQKLDKNILASCLSPHSNPNLTQLTTHHSSTKKLSMLRQKFRNPCLNKKAGWHITKKSKTQR